MDERWCMRDITRLSRCHESTPVCMRPTLPGNTSKIVHANPHQGKTQSSLPMGQTFGYTPAGSKRLGTGCSVP
jgi:hypothetical protein